MHATKSDHIIIYRNSWERDQDEFYQEHPEMAVWFMAGLGIFFLIVLGGVMTGWIRTWKMFRRNR